MKVSVIIATYNGAKTIKETIKSVLGQTFTDLELIVVDDGSTDNTVGVVQSIHDDRMTVLKQKNSGSPAAPRNKGITAAKGEFIAFCDHDDIWYPEKLSKQIQLYEESDCREDIGIVFCSADLISETGGKIDANITRYDGFVSSSDAYPDLLKGDYIIACSALVPKRVIDEVGLLDESLVGVDDYDLWLRICKKFGVLAIPEQLCAWRQSGGALSADKTKQYLETEKIFTKLNDQTDEIRIGHGKNLMRIFLSLVLQKNFADATKYREKLSKYPTSDKINSLLKTFDASKNLSHFQLTLLKKIGKVSL